MHTKTCNHTATGFIDISVPGSHGTTVTIALKCCDVCFQATPLNKRARKNYRRIAKETRALIRGHLQRKHPGHKII